MDPTGLSLPPPSRALPALCFKLQVNLASQEADDQRLQALEAERAPVALKRTAAERIKAPACWIGFCVLFGFVFVPSLSCGDG